MRIAALWEGFAFSRWYSGFVHNFLLTRVRSTALGFLCFGFLSGVLTVLKMFFSGADQHRVMDLALSLGIALASLFLALSRRTWSEALDRSFLGGLWLYRLGGFRRDEVVRPGEYPQGGRFSLVVGVLLGVLSFFVSPAWLFGGFVLCLVLLQILYKPELGLGLVALSLCFVSPGVLLALSVTVLTSFLFKYLRGKRVISWSSADALVLLLFAWWALGAAWGRAPWQSLCLSLVLYLLFSKMVRVTSLSRRLAGALVLGLLVYCFAFLGHLILSGAPWQVFRSLIFTVELQWGSPVLLTDVVMLLLPLSAVVTAGQGWSKLFGFSAMTLGLCALLFSQAPGALFCLALCLAVLILLLKKKALVLLLSLPAIFLAVFLISPHTLIGLFENVGPLFSHAWSEQVLMWQTVFSAGPLQILFGREADPGVFLNFWGSYLVRYGLLGAGLLIGVVVHLFGKLYRPVSAKQKDLSYRLSVGLCLSVAILLLRGLTTDLAQAGVYSLLWIFCGLLAAGPQLYPRPVGGEELL